MSERQMCRKGNKKEGVAVRTIVWVWVTRAVAAPSHVEVSRSTRNATRRGRRARGSAGKAEAEEVERNHGGILEYAPGPGDLTMCFDAALQPQPAASTPARRLS